MVITTALIQPIIFQKRDIFVYSGVKHMKIVIVHQSGRRRRCLQLQHRLGVLSIGSSFSFSFDLGPAVLLLFAMTTGVSMTGRLLLSSPMKKCPVDRNGECEW